MPLVGKKPASIRTAGVAQAGLTSKLDRELAREFFGPIDRAMFSDEFGPFDSFLEDFDGFDGPIRAADRVSAAVCA